MLYFWLCSGLFLDFLTPSRVRPGEDSLQSAIQGFCGLQDGQPKPSDGLPGLDISFTALSTFSPFGSQSLNGMRMRVCGYVSEWTE